MNNAKTTSKINEKQPDIKAKKMQQHQQWTKIKTKSRKTSIGH